MKMRTLHNEKDKGKLFMNIIMVYLENLWEND